MKKKKNRHTKFSFVDDIVSLVCGLEFIFAVHFFHSAFACRFQWLHFDFRWFNFLHNEQRLIFIWNSLPLSLSSAAYWMRIVLSVEYSSVISFLRWLLSFFFLRQIAIVASFCVIRSANSKRQPHESRKSQSDNDEFLHQKKKKKWVAHETVCARARYAQQTLTDKRQHPKFGTLISLKNYFSTFRLHFSPFFCLRIFFITMKYRWYQRYAFGLLTTTTTQ